jgi:chemotaxis protein MotB
MARKHKHEEHANHEAWAIPYGDLITLLLAFFVVMYAVSSVNEGKYRVLAEALAESFGGPPKSITPIQIGKTQQRGSQMEQNTSPVSMGKAQPSVAGTLRPTQNPTVFASDNPALVATQQRNAHGNTGYERSRRELNQLADNIEAALGELIRLDQIRIRRTEFALEVEMNTDALFASGSARLGDEALSTMAQLATLLRGVDQPLRIEGHTDDVPISTAAFPSNWELSSARAASVVHLFMNQGVMAARMTVAGMGEFHPVADNTTAAGRSRNRRVVIVVLATPDAPPDSMPAKQSTGDDDRG